MIQFLTYHLIVNCKLRIVNCFSINRGGYTYYYVCSHKHFSWCSTRTVSNLPALLFFLNQGKDIHNNRDIYHCCNSKWFFENLFLCRSLSGVVFQLIHLSGNNCNRYVLYPEQMKINPDIWSFIVFPLFQRKCIESAM